MYCFLDVLAFKGLQQTCPCHQGKKMVYILCKSIVRLPSSLEEHLITYIAITNFTKCAYAVRPNEK